MSFVRFQTKHHFYDLHTGLNEYMYFPRLSFCLLFSRHEPKPFVFWILLLMWVFLSGLFLSSFHLEPETFLLQNFKLQQWIFLQLLLPCFAAFSLGKIFSRIKTKCNSQKYWLTLQNSQVFVCEDLNLNAWWNAFFKIYFKIILKGILFPQIQNEGHDHFGYSRLGFAVQHLLVSHSVLYCQMYFSWLATTPRWHNRQELC